MSSCAVTSRPNAVSLVTLSGEFDVSNAPDVVAALDEAIADEQSRTVAVDLRGVAFPHSTLPPTLFSSRDRAQLVRKPVWLVRPEPLIWRVFTVTLIRELFRDFGTLEELEAYAAASIKTLQDPAAPKASAGS